MNGQFGLEIDNALTKDYTTYKLSGTIKKIIFPDSICQLLKLLEYLKINQIKYMVAGFGSNLVFIKDYDGVVIKLDKLNELKIDGNLVTVGAGYNLMKLSIKTAKLGLSGLEFASGIPATVGGAIYMNAGAYKSDMSEIVKEITVIDDNLELKKITNKELNFGYRTSLLKEKKYICVSAMLELQPGDKEEILKLIKERKERRLKSQPLEFPSAGSVFRNPEGDYAGRLIEELGFKGKKVGDAMVSEKHANFIVNVGNASGEDVKKLIIEIQNKVKEVYGIKLIVEQEFIE